MFDAGSGERPVGWQIMYEVAERDTSKPIALMLSHFHDDDISDAVSFDDIAFIDRPKIRSDISKNTYTISP